jgi:NHLM bacteriocin system ABC transporter peptidase/ATP-binding protein
MAATTAGTAERRLPKDRRRSRVPTVIQMEAVECGAAALAMILAYHGRNVPLQTLRDACQVSRDGTTALQMAKVARGYGMNAKGASKDLHELDTLATPFIAYWSFYHFVVVEGWDRTWVYINDPAMGPRRVSWDEMDSCFTGIVIDFEPTSEFERGGKRRSLVESLRTHLGPYKRALAFATVVGIFATIPGIAAAGFLSFFINRVISAASTGIIVGFMAAVVLAIVAQATLGWIQRRTMLSITTDFTTSLAAEMTWRVLRLPTRFFTQRQPGEISWRLQMPAMVSMLLAGPLPSAITGLISIVLYFVAMLVLSPLAAAAALVIGVLNFAILRAMARRQTERQELLMQEEGKLSAVVASGLSAIEFVKATGAEQELFTRFGGQAARVVSVRQETAAANQVFATLPGFLNILASAAVLGIGGFQVLNGDLSLGGLVALQVLAAGFLAPFGLLVQVGNSLLQFRAVMPKIDDVLEQEPETDGLRSSVPAATASDPNEPTPAAAKLQGRVEFRDVVFGYNPGGPPLLQGLSFTVEPGHRIAFVGTSGAGKSTVSRLLTGLERPWSGTILLDGVPRDEIPGAVLSSSLALVDQSILLFKGTVRDNLTLWDPSIQVGRATVAAQDAHIDDVIASRPEAYESAVDEGGRNFSGGQGQRLEIARALAMDPTILVLDEATSSLDALTEVRIDNELRRRGCTTLVIAHRLSTIRDADLILVLDKGAVVQSGTHDELLQMDGLYRTLVES